MEEKKYAGGSLKTSNNVAFGVNVPKVFNFWCFNPAIGLVLIHLILYKVFVCFNVENVNTKLL